MQQKLKAAKELRNAEKYDEALALLADLAVSEPNNPDVQYQIGWTYDASDRSQLSIPHYQLALELGLQEDKVGCFVALGSSLRATGEYKKAHDVLERGIQEFPEHRALKVFLAMTFYNLGEHKLATSTLLQQLAETTADKETAAYKAAFISYSEDLDAVW